MASNQPSVIVIGAGLSGLGAAESLVSAGFQDVKVLEASSHIGGRVHTLWLDEGKDDIYKVELGATWIHGVVGNPLFDIAKKMDLTKENKQFMPARFSQRIMREDVMRVMDDGTTVEKNVYDSVADRYKEAFEKAESTFSLGNNARTKPDVGVRTFVEKELEPYLLSFDRKEQQLRKSVLEHMLHYECSISGCNDMDDVSADQIGSYQVFPGGEPVPPHAYELLTDVLAHKLAPSNIFLNHEVKSVVWGSAVMNNSPSPESKCLQPDLIYPQSEKNNEGIDIISQFSNAKERACTVVCENGASFTADCVIVTCSIDYLKRNVHTLFNPPLPAAKQAAIQNLDMGTVEAIFLEFADLNFLPPGIGEMQLIWGETKKSARAGDTVEPWTRGCTEAYVEKTPKDNMLTVWVTGKGAELMETLSDEQVAEDLANMLTHFLQTDVPRPIRIIKSCWHSNPYIGGSYTYIPVGATVQDIHRLAEPLQDQHSNKPVLMFAGEATHASMYSTTHGALMSGHREAQRIIEAYSNAQNSNSEINTY